jgi:hypothetical protein
VAAQADTCAPGADRRQSQCVACRTQRDARSPISDERCGSSGGPQNPPRAHNSSADPGCAYGAIGGGSGRGLSLSGEQPGHRHRRGERVCLGGQPAASHGAHWAAGGFPRPRGVRCCAGAVALALGVGWAVRANAARASPPGVSSEGTVPLSEHERRQFEQIEQALRAGDPWFADAVRAADPRVHYRRRVIAAALGFLAGVRAAARGGRGQCHAEPRAPASGMLTVASIRNGVRKIEAGAPRRWRPPAQRWVWPAGRPVRTPTAIPPPTVAGGTRIMSAPRT